MGWENTVLQFLVCICFLFTVDKDLIVVFSEFDFFTLAEFDAVLFVR